MVRHRKRYLSRARGTAGIGGRRGRSRSRRSCRPSPASISIRRSGSISAPRAETCPVTSLSAGTPLTTPASPGSSASSSTGRAIAVPSPRLGCCQSCTKPSTWCRWPDSDRGPQRPGMTTEMQYGSADRRNIHAPERLRRSVERYQDRCADNRRMGDSDQPAATGGQGVHPATHPVDQIDNGFATVRRPGRIRQPDREVRGPHAAEHITAPTTALQIGQPLVDIACRPSSSAVCLCASPARRMHRP